MPSDRTALVQTFSITAQSTDHQNFAPEPLTLAVTIVKVARSAVYNTLRGMHVKPPKQAGG
jgi:hypothetical protein